MSIVQYLRLFKCLIQKNIPLYVHYGLTHRCNLRCRMCSIYQDEKEGEELSIIQIDKAFDFLKSLGIIYVSIGGGEPFLRKDLPLIISILRKKGFFVRLLTNGTLTNEDLVREVILNGLREVSISLDTLDPQKQDYICNCNGSWEKIIKSIEFFRNILPNDKAMLLINTVVSPLNIMELPELSKFVKEKGCYISFVPVENNGICEFSFKESEHKYIDKSYKDLIKLKKESRNNIFNSSLFLEKSHQYLKDRKHDWRCDAGKLYLSLSPGGELSACHKSGFSISLAKEINKNFVKSEEFKSYSEDLASKCSGCMRPCWAEVSFLFKDKRSFWEMLRMRLL